MQNCTRTALLLVVCAIFAASAGAQVVTVTTSYLEDFNGNAVGSAGSSCPGPGAEPLVNGWTNLAGELPSDNEWVPDNNGTVSGGTGPSDDADGLGLGGIYLFTETSGTCSGGDVAIVESPIFNTSAMSNPGFSCAYHMFGDDQGELHFDLVNVSQGTTTQDVIAPFIGDMGDVWLNTGLVSVNALLTDPADEFRIAIRTISGPGFESDTAIDNFEIVEIPSNDVGVIAVTPSGSVGVGPATVTVTIENFGLVTETSIPVEFIINGGAGGTAAETYVGSIAPGGTDTFTFTTPANLVAGLNTIDAFTVLGLDGDPSNDITNGTATGFALVNTFPYCEDFESSDGGYVGDNEWQYGAPAGTLINAAASGTSAWVTNLTGNYSTSTTSTLTSPIFDCSALVAPQVNFNIQYESELNFDGCVVEISFDGVNFALLGSVGSGTNWYNNATDVWWDNSSGGIINAANTLDGAAGQPVVQLRWVFFSDSSVTREGFMLDDVKIEEITQGAGQAPQPGVATLDFNNAVEQNGFSVGVGLNGPYTTTITTGNDYDITMTGEANQAIILLLGTTSVGAIPLPPIGQFDLDPASASIVADGTLISLLDSLFVLDASGQRVLTFPATPGLAGASFSFQALMFNSVVPGFSNMVEVTFM